MTIDKIVVRVL